MKFWLMTRRVTGGDVLYSSRLIAHERAPAQKLAGARGIYNQMLFFFYVSTTLVFDTTSPRVGALRCDGRAQGDCLKSGWLGPVMGVSPP